MMVVKMKGMQRNLNWANTKRAAALLLSLIILLSMFSMLAVSAETGCSVTITGNDEEVYYAGEAAPFAIHIDTFGLDISDSLVNPVLTLYYDTSDIEGATLEPAINVESAPGPLSKIPMDIDAEASTVTWHLDDLPKGTEFTLLGDISMPEDGTPAGYLLTLRAVLTSDSHSPVESEIVIEWQCGERETEEDVAGDEPIFALSEMDPPEGTETSYGATILRDDLGYEVYYVGTTAHFKIHVEVSGLDMSDILINPVLTLYYDTSDIEGATQKPTVFVQDILSSLLKSPKITDAAASTITWNLNDLMGGTDFLMLGEIIMPKDTTPMGYPLKLKAVLTSDSHPPVESEIVIKWQYDKKVPEKVITKNDAVHEIGHIGGVNNYMVFAGLSYEEGDDRFIDPGYTWPVTYTFDNNSTHILDQTRSIDYITIVDHLPEGATFDPSENPGWVYDAETHTATYSGWDSTARLNLRFPGCKVAENYLNTAEYTYHIKNIQFDDPLPGEYTYEIAAWVRLDDNDVEGEIYIKEPIKTVRASNLSSTEFHANRLAFDDQILGEYWYFSSFNNPMKLTNIKNVMISDAELNVNLKFTSFVVCASVGAIVDTATVQYRVAGQSEWTDFVTLTEADLTLEQKPVSEFIGTSRGRHVDRYTEIFILPRGLVIDGLRLLVPELKALGAVHLDTGAVLCRPEDYIDENRPTSAVYFDNTSSFHCDDPQTGLPKNLGTFTAYNDIVPYAPKFRGMKTVTGAPATGQIFVGDILTISNRLRFYDFDKEDAILFEGGQIIDLLPQGIEYVPGSMAFTNLNGQVLRDHYENIEPVIIYDYQGTGMTALIWNLKGELDISWFKGEYIFYFNYKVEVLETVEPGISTLISYFHWPESYKIIGTTNNQSASGVYKGYVPFVDTIDVNGNGKTDEWFLKCELALNYQAPTAVVATKGAKGSANSSYQYAPALGYSQLGKPSSFRLYVMNYSVGAMSSLTLFDVLPYVGDKALVANSGGTYVGRGSAFEVRLTGAIEIEDDRFEVFYSSENPEPWDGIAAYETKVAGGAGWLTAEEVGLAWTDIRTFKVVLKAGETLEKGDGVVAIVPVVMPEEGETGSRTWNSFAINSGDVYLEAVKAGIEIIEYDVAIEKTADAYFYNLGDTATYTLKVTNTKKTGVTGAYVIDTIPEGLTFVSCNRAPPENYNPVTRELRIDVGALAPLQSTSITVTCTVDELGIFVNTATVTVNEDESTYVNNTDDCEIAAVIPGSLTVEKQLEGWTEWWDADETTVFSAKIKDAATGLYLTFLGTAPNYIYMGKSPTGHLVTFSVNTPAVISELPVGMVCIVEETKALHYTPEYIGNGEAITDGGNCIVTVVNTYSDWTLPMVGGTGNRPFYTTGLIGMLLTLAAFAGILPYARRRRRRCLNQVE